MAELVSKSSSKSINWDYFSLELGADGKPVDDGSAVLQSFQKRVLAKHRNTSKLLARFRRTTLHSIHKQKEPWTGRASSRHGRLHLRQQ